MAIHGVSVDPNSRRFADFYQRLYRKISHIPLKAPFHEKLSQVMSKVRLPGTLSARLSKVRKRRRKRKRNNLGKVVCYSAQEVKSLSQRDNTEGTHVGDTEIINDLVSPMPV